MTEDLYHPIPCAIYSAYELAALHRQRLRLAWREPDGSRHLQTVSPIDLETAHGEEFMIALTAGGERLRLRLDRILRSEPID